MIGTAFNRTATMKRWLRHVSLLAVLPAMAAAQRPQPIPAQPLPFATLNDSAWVRVSSTGQVRREARLLEHSNTEIVLDLEPQPLRIPVASIDTVWERRSASKTGAWVGALVGAGAGILVATQAVEEGESPGGDYIALFAVGGATGVGLLGALAGRAIPRWHRVYAR
jgi:hypothetical protein